MFVKQLGGVNEQVVGRLNMEKAPGLRVAGSQTAGDVFRCHAGAAQIDIEPVAGCARAFDAAAAVVVGAAADAAPAAARGWRA